MNVSALAAKRDKTGARINLAKQHQPTVRAEVVALEVSLQTTSSQGDQNLSV